MLKKLVRRVSGRGDPSTESHHNDVPIVQPKLRNPNMDVSKFKTVESSTPKKVDVVTVEHPRFAGPTPPFILAYEGRFDELKAAIQENPYIVEEAYNYNGNTPLLSRQEESDELFIPPPLVPKNVRAALAIGDVRRMSREDRWVLSKGFDESSLLHYACAGNRLQIVKYLIEHAGADRHAVNINQKPAEYYTDSDAILEYIWSRDRQQQYQSSRDDKSRAKTKSGRILKPRASEYLEKLKVTLDKVNIPDEASDAPDDQSTGIVFTSRKPFSDENVTRKPFANVPLVADDGETSSHRSSFTAGDGQGSTTNSRRLSKRRMSRVLSTRRMQEQENDDAKSERSQKRAPPLPPSLAALVASNQSRPLPPPPSATVTEAPKVSSDESLLDEIEVPSEAGSEAGGEVNLLSALYRPPIVLRRLSVNSSNSGHSEETKSSRGDRREQETAVQREAKRESRRAVGDTNKSVRQRPPPPPPAPTGAGAPPPPAPPQAKATHQPLPPAPAAAKTPPPPQPPSSSTATVTFDRLPTSATKGSPEHKGEASFSAAFVSSIRSPSLSKQFPERRSSYRSNRELIDDEFELALQLAFQEAKEKNDRIQAEAKETQHLHQLERAADILKRFRPIEHLANTLLSENSETQEHVYKRAQRNLRLLQQQQQQRRPLQSQQQSDRRAPPGKTQVTFHASDRYSEAGDSIVSAASSSVAPSLSSVLVPSHVRSKRGVSCESVTFLEMIWQHASRKMNRGVFDTPAEHANSRQAREFHALRQEAYRDGVRMLKREFRSYAHKENWEGIELLRMKALTTMLELRRRMRAARRAEKLGLAASSASVGDGDKDVAVLASPEASPMPRSLRKSVSFAGQHHRLPTTASAAPVAEGTGEMRGGLKRKKSVVDVLLAEGQRADDSFHLNRSMSRSFSRSQSMRLSTGARGILTVQDLATEDVDDPDMQAALEEEQLLRHAVRRLSTVDNDFDLEKELEALQRRMELTELFGRK
jgi:hypothetical protein